VIKFVPHPEIALPEKDKTYNPGDYGPQYKAVYHSDYPRLFSKIAGIEDEGERYQAEIATYRWLIQNDLFFIGFFVCENPFMNHPFAVDKCRMVKKGPQSDTLDVWARFHLKSSIITQYETLQYIVNDPEMCHCIFSYSKPAAEKHLLGIKEALQKEIMLACFPEICYERASESPSWSLQGGIRVKRSSVSRKEHTVQAYGLLEGMPTGGHWDRLIFDDTETEDIARSGDQIRQLIKAFDMAQSFGMPYTTYRRIIGTFYTHCGLLTDLRDRRYKDGSQEKMFIFRKYPATDDGTKNGKPVFMSDDEWRKVLTLSTCNSQYLCNPSPTDDIRLDFSMFKPIEPQFMPKNRLKFVIIDPAGDDAVQSGTKNDLWAIGCVSVKPCMDELGLSEIYIEDIVADRMPLNTAIDAAVGLYIRNGRIVGLGIEKVGNDTTYEHIRKALIAKGRYVNIKKSDRDNGNLVLLSPEGRNKEWRVESALSWPLSNSKIFYSTAISSEILGKMKDECEKFGFIHLDILDMIAYVYKMIETMKIYLESQVYLEDDENEKEKYHAETEYNPFAV
jgi:hypothetical protein